VGRKGIRARHHDKGRIAARVAYRVHLLHHLLRRDDLFALHVPAALGPGLVLNHQAGHPRLLKGARRVVHVDGIAIARVGIRQQGEGAARRQSRDSRQVELESHQAHITPAQEGLT